MATEANISEPVYIKEKEEVNVNFNPHDINHPPETGDHLMKSEKVQELDQDGVEAKQLDLKANMEVLEGENFLKSPSFAMVDSQETCQDLDLSPQTAKERPESGEENEKHEVSEVEEEMLTDKIETLKEREETAERNERDFEIVDDKGTGYQEDESAKVLSGAEEDKTSKEEKALEENGGDINSLASAEEKQENIQKQISSLQISEEVEKKIDENTESAADEELSRHEAKLGEFKEAPIRTPDPTVDNLETGAETFKVSISEQESGDTSARSEPKVSEEIIGRKVVDGLVEKETCCLEEEDPVAIIPIGKTENDKEGIAFSTVGETSSIEEATPGVDIDKEASSEIREGMMCELDIASISPATDFSSTQQTVSKVEDKLGQLSVITSNEEEENKVESSRHIKDVNVAVDQRQEKQKIETPIVTQGDHMYPQKEDNSDTVNIVSVESDSHDDFKNDPPESEILGETVLADSVSGHTVISAEDIRTSVEHNKEETSKLEENWEEFSKEQYELENEMNLPPRELDEEIKVLIRDKNVNDLKKPNSLEPEAELVEDSKLEEACDIHSQNQVQEVKKVSKVEEKHIQNESEAHENKLEPEGTGKIPQTENMHNVAESDSEVKLGSKDSVMNVEDKTQEIEKSSEHIERSNTEEEPPIEVISTDAEISQAESLQQAAASTLRVEVEETIKTTGVKSDEVHNGPKMIGSREATDEQNTITDDSVIESLRNTGRKAEILDEQDIVSQRMGDDTIKGSSQEYAEEGPSKNFEIDDVDTEKLSRKDYEGSETDGSIVNEIDRSANLTFQFSVVNDQESLKGERSTGEEVAQEKREIKVNDNESNSEPPEVHEEIKEALKHEEEVEEKLQNYEPGESIERSNKALFPDSKADKCDETAYKPKGEKADGPEESAEAEMPNVKDTDGQLADMSNIKYLSQEPDKEEMVNNFQTSETNAQISNKENDEESENVGTGQSSASETNHDGEGLNSTLATSLVEETEIVQDKHKNIARSEASLGEKKEENVSTVQAVEGNVSSVQLEEANQNSKETTKCEENNEPEEVENTAILMAVDNEALASNEKDTDDAEEIQNVEENTVEEGKEGIKDTDGTKVESVAMEANQNNETTEYEAEAKLGKNEVEEIDSSGVPLTIETEALTSSEETIDENVDIQNDEENTMQEKKEGIKDETEAEKVAVKEKANLNSEETTECEAQVELAKNEVKEIGNSGIPSVIVNEATISNEKTIDKTEYIQNVKEEEEVNQKREEATESEGHVELEKDETAEFENSGIPLAIENEPPISDEKTIDETEYIQNLKAEDEANQSREKATESEGHVELERDETAEFENSGIPLAIENDATVSNEMTIDETEYIQNVKEDEEANQNRKEITEGEEHAKPEKNEAEEFENSGIHSAIENEAPISNENAIDEIEYIQNVREDKEAAHNREEASESEAHVEFEKNAAAEFENSGNPLAIENEAPISDEKPIDETEYIQNVKEEEEANQNREEATESKTFVELKRNEAEDFENSGIPSAIENEALLSNKNTIDETEDAQNVEEKKEIGMMVTDETEVERVAVTEDANQNSEETTKYGEHALQDLQKNEPEEIENSALQALGNEAPISNEKKTDDALGILNIEEKKEGAKDTNEIKVERVAVKEVAQVVEETSSDRRGEKADGPEENAEAEMRKVKDTDGQLADESNIKSLSLESTKEEMVNNFQTSETNAQISHKENVDESENAGTGQSSASETNHNDESLNSTLATSLVEETEIVQDKSKNMARSEASSGKKKEEYVSTVQAVEGNVSSIRLEEANQNSKETAKCEENNEPEEVENSAILMAVDNEASASNEKATDDAEEIQHDEENTVEGGKEGFKDTDGTEVESVAMKEANQNNEETAEYEAEVKLGKNEVEEIESTGVPLTIENEAMISSEMTIDENEDIQNVENTMQEKKEEGIKDETEAERVAVKEKANRNSEETTECEAQVELAKNEVEEIGNTGIPSAVINEAPISNEKTIDETEYIQNVKEEEEANQKREEATESEGHVELEKNEVEDFKNSGISSAIENGAPLSNEKTTDETEDIQNVEEKKEVGMKVTDETEVERVAVKEDANQNSEETTNYGEQDLQKNEPEEIEISASQVLGNEAPISNEKETHDPLCILNIEEKKDEGAKDTNEIKVERVAVKEVAQVVEETSNDRSTVDEQPITSETEVEKLENAYGADSTEKVEEETKDEETKEKHGSEKSADFIKDSETQTLMEEHTGTNISRLSTEDIALSCRPDEAEGKSKEEILEEPDKIRAAKDPENEANKLNKRIIEQSREIVTEDDVKLMMPKQEEQEVICKIDEVNVKQIIHESEKLEISQEKHGENPLQKEKEFENDAMELKEEVKELNSEATASVEATVSELLTDKERSSGLHSAEASEDLTLSKETSESQISVSIPKSDSKELSGKVQPEAHECSCESVRDLTEERSPTGPELPTSDTKEPIITDTKETTLMGGDIDVKPENFSDLVEKNDSPILVVTNETEEESRHEVSNDATLAGRETEKELVAAETPPCSTLDAKESEKSEAIERIDENLEIDQNAYDNAVNPLVPQSTASTRDEDKTVNTQEVATLGSLDTGIERTTEKVQYYQSENVQEHPDLQTEVHTLKQEETELTYVEETRNLVIEGESGKSKKLDYMESSLPVASLESIEPTSAGRKITILEEENPLNISEVTLQEGAAPEKGDREIEKGNQKQEVEAADHIKCHGQTEENLGSVESSEKLESVGETDKSDQSNISTYEVKPNTIEEINSENQSQCLDSIEKRFQESQTEEMAEPELEAEVSSIKLQNTDETTKAVISVEQVKEDVEETDGDETLKHTLVESNNKKELQSESAVDDTIDEVKESSRAFTEDPVAKDSTEQTEITNLNSQVQPPLEQEKSAIKGEEEENAENEVSKKPIGSVTVVAEEPEELIKEKIVDEGNRCSKEINVADAAEVKPASGSEVAQIDDKIVHISNITSDEIKADTFDSERIQQNIIDTRILENSSSHLASQISADDPESLTNDNVVPKHADGSKHLLDTVNELKGTDKKGPLTGDIEEEIKELSETVPTSEDIEEIATKEVLADENLQEQISYHQIASSPLPSQEEGPGTEATVENVEERTIQVVKMTDEDPNEMHEEAAQTSDEIGEKKEACESNSKSSEDIEIVKHDLTASPEAMHVKKSEEQYQTTSAPLLPEDMEYKRSETTASSGEENNVKVLESKPRSSENPRIFEEPNEDDTPQLDVQLGKDELEENAIESRQEGSRDPDSHKIEEINEQASELAADSNSKYFEIVADDIVTSSQTPAVENFEEKNEAPHSVLHLKDTDHGTLVATEKIEEVEVLKDGLATAEDPSLQKEELREAEVLPMELPFQKDIQKELIEECEEQGREANGVHRFEEIKEDKIILPTQKSEELSQTQTDSLLPKEQDTTTDAVQNTKEQQVKIATREVTEEPCLQKEKTEDLQVSGLEVQHKNVDKKENMYQPQEDEIRTAEMLELCPKDLESKTKDSDCTTEIEKIPEMMGPIEETSEHMTKATNEDLQYMSEAPSHEPADQSEETVSRERHQEEALADATEIINDEAKEEAIADATEIIHDKAKEEALANATEIKHDEAKEQVLTDATEVIHDEAIEKEILEKKEPASTSPSVILGEAIAEGSNQEHRVNAEEKQMQSGEINKEIQEGDTSKKSEEQISSDHSSCQKFHREEINEQASELAAESNSKYFEIVADDVVTSSQTAAVENFEEKNEAPPSVLHLKDTDHGLVATEKIEEVEVLKDGLATAEDPFLQKEELGEAELLTMELPLMKDIQKELIEEREEQGREANEVHRFEEIKEDNIVIPTQKSEELRQTKTASLLPKEQDTTTGAVQNTEEQQVKIATRDVTEEPCSQKEKTEDLQVSRLEFQHKKDEDSEHLYQAQEYEIRTAQMLELCPKDLESKTKDSQCTTEIEQIPEMTGTMEATSEHRTKAPNEVLQSVSEAPSHEPAIQSEETASRDKHQEKVLADATEIINDEAKEEALAIATGIVHDGAKEEALADATEIIHDEAKEEAVADATEIINDEAKKEALADATEIVHTEAKEEALADTTEITHDEAKEQALADATEIIHDEAIEKEILVKKETVSTSPSVILGEAIAEGSNQERRVNTEEKQMQSGEINKEIQEGDTSKKSEEQISSEHSSCQKFHHKVVREMCKTEPVLLVSEVEHGIEIAQNEGSLDLAKANETIPDINHGKKISDATSQEQFSTGKVGIPQVQQGLIVETIQNVEGGNLQPENVRMVDAVIKGPEEGKMDDKTEKSIAETVAEDSGKVSLFDIMARSKIEGQISENLTTGNEEVKAETEKPKSGNEEEEGGEQEKADSGPAAPVMVEATKDMEVKVEHKKSHNILAGVGSKVKHSISKVKKAIIGKSSHPKQHSPSKTK